MKVIVAYIPVLHRGYMNFLRSQKDLKMIFVIDSELAIELDPKLKKDIRAIASEDVVAMLKPVFRDMGVYSISSAKYISSDQLIVMPDEDISRAFVNRFIPELEVQYQGVFLRWDRTSSTKQDEVAHDIELSTADFDRQVMYDCRFEAAKSADWWRHVGGCIIKHGDVLMPPLHNKHVPSPNQPYYDGDPRAVFSRGENIEIGTALHVELNLISMAAAAGLSLLGASLYVTTFPCPWCAKAIAYSGISEVYFEEGYSVLDAQDILTKNNVKLIRVVK